MDAADLWSRIGFPIAIVRSSAVGEDSPDASFAGQLDSIPGVTTPDALRDALARVWASQRSARVLAYQAARGITLAGMGIIIQRQVQASLSGVLFTVSPTDPGEMLLEYCGGMGEALVSGAVNPGRVSIRRPPSDRPVKIASCVRLTRLRQGAAVRRSFSGPKPDTTRGRRPLRLTIPRLRRPSCSTTSRSRSWRGSRSTSSGRFGAPQDIEWTIDGDGQLWIVQSRPITAGPKAGRSGGSKVQWSNANVNENFPQPISPLLYSVARLGYYHYFRNLGRAFGVSRDRLALMEPALRQIIGVHGARMYYNLTSIHSVLRSVPFGDVLARSFNQFVGAEDTAAARVGPGYRLTQKRLRPRRGAQRVEPQGPQTVEAVELAVITGKTTWQYLFLTRRVERFEATVDAYAATTHPDRLRDRSLPDLLARFPRLHGHPLPSLERRGAC